MSNLKITHNFSKDFHIEIPYFVPVVILPKEYSLHFKIHFVLSPVWVEVHEFSGNTIIFNFEDALGNKYEQYLFYKGSNKLFMQPAFNTLS